MIKRLKEILVMDNGFVRFYNDKVLFGDGSEGDYARMSFSSKGKPFGISVVCEFEGGIVLQDSYRYAPQETMVEIVKGMGMDGKTALETARIEIKEEIGGEIESIESLGIIQPDMADFKIHCFVAKIKELGATQHEKTESISNIRVKSIDEVFDMVVKDEIKDELTLGILFKYIAFKKK